MCEGTATRVRLNYTGSQQLRSTAPTAPYHQTLMHNRHNRPQQGGPLAADSYLHAVALTLQTGPVCLESPCHPQTPSESGALWITLTLKPLLEYSCCSV